MNVNFHGSTSNRAIVKGISMAQEKEQQRFEQAITAIRAEIERQWAQWGPFDQLDNPNNVLPLRSGPDEITKLAVATEELGEVARAINEMRHFGSENLSPLRAEIVQCAAVFTHWLMALDRDRDAQGQLACWADEPEAT